MFVIFIVGIGFLVVVVVKVWVDVQLDVMVW